MEVTEGEEMFESLSGEFAGVWVTTDPQEVKPDTERTGGGGRGMAGTEEVRVVIRTDRTV